MEPFRGGLDHTREDKKPSDEKGNASDADQLSVSPSLRRGNDRRWASPCPLYEPLFRLNYVALPPRPKPAAAAIQEGSYPVSRSRCLKRWILLARHCPRMVLADLPDPRCRRRDHRRTARHHDPAQDGSLCVRLASPTLDVPSGPAIVLVA